MSLMDVLSKEGAMDIIAELSFKPMRYVELKNRTGLPDSTLARRLNELIKCGLVIQKPLKTASGRYRLFYEIMIEEGRIIKTGLELANREIAVERSLEKLEKSYVRALSALSLTERQKKVAKEELIKKFRSIRGRVKKLVNFEYAKAYLEAVNCAKTSSI